MHKINTFAAAAALAAALGAGLMGAGRAQAADGQITVTGEGQVQVIPDMATLRLGVENEGTTAAEAMGANSTAMRAVLATLQEAGIEPRDIQTGGLSLNPIYAEYRQGEAPKLRGYGARNMVTVRLRAIDRLGTVLDQVIGTGANSLQGIEFGLAEPQDQLDAARRAAVAEARRKAALYADAAGVTLGGVVSIDEQGGPMPVFEMRAASLGKADGVPVAAGEMTLSAQVNVVFELAP